jgi:hypothetical protein
MMKAFCVNISEKILQFDYLEMSLENILYI